MDLGLCGPGDDSSQTMAGEKECSPCHFLAHPSRLDRGQEVYQEVGLEPSDEVAPTGYRAGGAS